MRHEHILHAANSALWAAERWKLDEIFGLLADRSAGLEISADDRQKLMAAAEDRQRPDRHGSIAVIPAMGVLAQRMNMLMACSGGTSTEQLARQVRMCSEDPNVSTILLHIDSPGGTVEGVTECAAEIMRAREIKPVIGSVDARAGSGGYWIAAQCSEICVTPSGAVGGIGVFMKHEDLSGAAEQAGVKVSYVSAGDFKVDGNPFEPLSDDARGHFQNMVNSTYDMFLKDVARGRGITAAQVRESYGKGRMFLARDAKAAGMVDRIESFDETVARLTRGKATTSTRKAEDMTPARKVDLLNV